MIIIVKYALNILLSTRGHNFLNYTHGVVEFLNLRDVSRFAKHITASDRNRFRTLSGQRSGGDLSASCR